jgi:hypothetical protein
MSIILYCCWRQTDALFIAVFYAIYCKIKFHGREKYIVTKYHYGITKQMTGVCDTPIDKRRAKWKTTLK